MKLSHSRTNDETHKNSGRAFSSTLAAFYDKMNAWDVGAHKFRFSWWLFMEMVEHKLLIEA